MSLIKHEIMEFDRNGNVSRFLVSIAYDGKKTSICFTEPLNNPGMSITNAAEDVIPRVIKYLGLDATSQELKFYERYLPNRYGCNERETFDEIIYDHETGRVGWRSHKPSEYFEIFGKPPVIGSDGNIVVEGKRLNYNCPQEFNFKPGDDQWNSSKS